MALWGYCLGPWIAESCYWCLCELQRVIVLMQKNSSIDLFDWINQLGAYRPLGLLSGPLYRRKLLSLVFMWTLRCNSFNAKRLIHKSLRQNKSVRGHYGPLGLLSGRLYWRKLWYDMIWYDMIWYDMIWYDMIWYDFVCTKSQPLRPNYSVQYKTREKKTEKKTQYDQKQS